MIELHVHEIPDPDPTDITAPEHLVEICPTCDGDRVIELTYADVCQYGAAPELAGVVAEVRRCEDCNGKGYLTPCPCGGAADCVDCNGSGWWKWGE